MSFTSEIKAELCRREVSRRCCARAEACGILLYCSRFSGEEIRISTSSAVFARRLPGLFRRAFGFSFDSVRANGATGRESLLITEKDKISHIYEQCAFSPAAPSHHINFGLLEEQHCRRAFLRGAFLAGGTVTDPGKAYHMELSTTHAHVCRELSALLQDMGYSPKVSQRKSSHLVYFKQSEVIESLLTDIGAPVSSMAMMNAKAEKLLRNGINRRVNCEVANVDKTTDAALEQRAAIRRLREDGRLEKLTPKMREAAALRENYPELSLAQLAALCVPPVTKSSLSHRLKKIVEMSRANPEEEN